MGKRANSNVATQPCPICGTGLVPSCFDVILINGVKSKSANRFSGEKLYCYGHFSKMFHEIGLSYGDIKYLHDSILKKVPSINYVFNYALAVALMNGIEEKNDVFKDEIVSRVKAGKESVFIPAEKNLPGFDVGILITMNEIPRHQPSPTEQSYESSLVTASKVMARARNLGLDLEVGLASDWSCYLSKLRLIESSTHSYVPTISNFPVKVPAMLKFAS